MIGKYFEGQMFQRPQEQNEPPTVVTDWKLRKSSPHQDVPNFGSGNVKAHTPLDLRRSFLSCTTHPVSLPDLFIFWVDRITQAKLICVTGKLVTTSYCVTSASEVVHFWAHPVNAQKCCKAHPRLPIQERCPLVPALVGISSGIISPFFPSVSFQGGAFIPSLIHNSAGAFKLNKLHY